MKKLFLSTIAAILALAAYAEDFQPKAAEKAVVVQGKARFTILTDRLIRMEWAEDGVFEDNATLGMVNRNLPVPEFRVRKTGNSLTINTGKVQLSYKGNGKFDARNLSASFTMNGKKCRWYPGLPDEGNLLGTARTLDKFKGETTIDPYDKGVASRDGWAIIDESSRHLLKKVDSDWEYWVEERPEGDRQDWYLFAYGHDYTAAVGDFTKVAGRIPIPPKYAFGYWWCRYWTYSDAEIRDLIAHFRDFSIPLDVFIIDMDWHKTWGYYNNHPKVLDAAGEKLGWTGYTWDENLFPNPEALLHEMQDECVQTSLNLHPASGIMPFEEPYNRFVKDYLSRTNDYDGPKNYTDSLGKPAYVPFRICQQEWADAYFNSVIRPLEKQGVSFWWLDWQQYRESRYVKDLSNTFWLNYTFWNDMVRQSAYQGTKARRPMIYHRWGGIGSHRYQVGFSGDTYASWKVLGALPYFTFTASNVGYCYWGHDIGGHMQPKGIKHTDPELYTRWMQSGVFTPIYKTHSTKDASMEKRFWQFPRYFDAMREAIRLRYDLSPYIYTAAREAYDTGIGICRPLYYAYPEEERAYTEKEEFFFGKDILATTVCTPTDKVTGLSTRSMWFPEGNDWFDVSTGRMYKGGTADTLRYTIDENPWFVREGAVIPLAGRKIRNLQEPSGELRLCVVPGPGRFDTTVYEDDGKTQAYPDAYATTDIHKTTTADFVEITVDARKGSYDGAPATRRISIEIQGAAAPSKVIVNGSEAGFRYDGDNLCAIVDIAEMTADRPVTVRIFTTFAFTAGQKGLIRRMHALSEEGKMNGGFSEFIKFSNAGSAITDNPSKAADILGSLKIDALKKEFEKSSKSTPGFITKLMMQAQPEQASLRKF